MAATRTADAMRLTIPFAAITSFAEPSAAAVNETGAAGCGRQARQTGHAIGESAEAVTLDRFRMR